MLPVNLSERCGDHVMNVRVLEPVDEKALERVDALGRCVFGSVNRCKFAERRAPAQIDATIYHRMRLNPAQQERDARTKSHTDQGRWRRKSAFIRLKERTAQRPFRGPVALPLDGNGGCAVRHNSDSCLTLRRDHPKASDIAPQRVSRFLEANLRAIDECSTNAHSVRI